MDLLDQKPSVGGGAARSGGDFYHLSFRSGSRAGGASARAAHEYVTRQGEYGGPDRDPAVYTESDHMPSWASDDPVELSSEDRIALASEFAHELTDNEDLPYTLAIHAGRDEDGDDHNPHAHLMFSERSNDGIERWREEWFKPANSEHPERRGAPKSRTFHGSAWVERARERWAALTNEKLAKAGRSDRVDPRSYARQGIDRQPAFTTDQAPRTSPAAGMTTTGSNPRRRR